MSESVCEKNILVCEREGYGREREIEGRERASFVWLEKKYIYTRKPGVNILYSLTLNITWIRHALKLFYYEKMSLSYVKYSWANFRRIFVCKTLKLYEDIFPRVRKVTIYISYIVKFISKHTIEIILFVKEMYWLRCFSYIPKHLSSKNCRDWVTPYTPTPSSLCVTVTQHIATNWNQILIKDKKNTRDDRIFSTVKRRREWKTTIQSCVYELLYH